jgi:pimeloyl-ACP methyl ester carboxylesterase
MEIGACGFTFEADVAGNPGDELVLLLHGFPQTSHTWREQLPALGNAGYYAVAPNQRGYSPGARPAGREHYATELLVADALAMADTLNCERFHLVGHDWGGQLTWLIAAHHREVVKTLTVLSRPHPAAFAKAMAADPEQANRSRHHKAFQSDDAVALLLADDAQRLRSALTDQGVPEADARAYLERLSTPDALEAAVNWYRAGSGDSALVGDDVPTVAVPTLYLWGNSDATVGRLAAEATAESVSGAYRFEVIDGAGHFLTDQAPMLVNTLLLAHLAEHRL